MQSAASRSPRASRPADTSFAHTFPEHRMPTRSASANWTGTLKGGKGNFKAAGGLGGPYTFATRFEDAAGGVNPEDLLAAAEAACFSMALSGGLEKNGTPATSIDTNARCTV